MGEKLTEKEAIERGFHIGSIKWFDEVKGYGFIIDDEPGRPDVFCHASVFDKHGIKASELQRIGFKPRQGPKGMAAHELVDVSGGKS